jgi:hypothetical protein
VTAGLNFRAPAVGASASTSILYPIRGGAKWASALSVTLIAMI